MNDEERHYRDEHFVLFGHYPIPDLKTGRKCGHVVHDAMKQAMTQPGMVLEIPFEDRAVLTEDDAVVLDWHAEQEEDRNRWRQWIKDTEEREKFLNRDPAHKKKVF